MSLSESASIAYGVLEPEPESPLQLEESLKDQRPSPLSKQSSIFSLTLKSSKSVRSTNMDEFLINLWNNNVEENQVSSQTQNNQNEHQPIDDDIPNMIMQNETLTRQNSFYIPIQISNKTVEEVWSEIQKDQPLYPNNIASTHEPFGEITLEEFLIKAGVVQEPIPTTTTMTSVSHQQKLEQQSIQMNNHSTCLDDNFGTGPNPMVALGFSTHQNAGNNLLVNGYGTYPIYTAPTKFVAVGVGVQGDITINDKGHGVLETTGTGIKTNRERTIDGPSEVVVERRQQRMIKNRESAARSRARKQAYTVELELQLTELKEENEKLKQTVKELEQKRAQEILKRIKQSKLARKKGEKLKTLRRTSSSAW